ncbi:MAG: MarR family winged helix-turn-helix transcriptional regulator [Gaiellaceae bacterium]
MQRETAPETWGQLLRAQACLRRALSVELQQRHGLSINDYEVLLHLAGDECLRRVDLAARVSLTASGITRLLDGLELAGLVAKGECPTDRRATYALITDAGRTRLAEASCTHVQAIRKLFAERYTAEEIATLGELLGRLPAAPESCCDAA